MHDVQVTRTTEKQNKFRSSRGNRWARRQLEVRGGGQLEVRRGGGRQSSLGHGGWGGQQPSLGDLVLGGGGALHPVCMLKNALLDLMYTRLTQSQLQVTGHKYNNKIMEKRSQRQTESIRQSEKATVKKELPTSQNFIYEEQLAIFVI